MLFLLLLGGTLHVCAAAQTDPDTAALSAWLNTQTNIQTWEADFVQTRNSQALSLPATGSGHIWFQAPNRFRWEMTQPANTIAVRQPTQMLIIYPRLKRVERYALDDSAAGPWGDILALLDAGFPRSRADIDSRFNLIAQTTTNGVHEITLRPKSEAARHVIPQIKIAFDAASFALHATELQFADGSTMQNTFSNAVMNPKIDESRFNPPIGADFKTNEPLKHK